MTGVRFRWLAHGAGLPKPEYRTAGAAGLDLAAAVPEQWPLVLAPGKRALVPTGLALELPEGLEAQIRPRSGLALSNGITVLNTPGTIDADYRGEIGVILLNLGDQDFHVFRGLRIAQLVVSAYVQIVLIESVELSGTTRGDKGFGSTNDNGCAD